jgi:uncharacterized protein (DUF2062 family)
MSLKKRVRYAYYRAVRHHGRPTEIAAGSAIGMAVSLTPIVGHTAVAVALAALTGRNKLAAALGVWINNPVTFLPISIVSYVLGAWLLGYPLTPPGGFLRAFSNLASFGSELFLPTLLGSLILGIPTALGGYWFTHQIVLAHRRNRHCRRAGRTHSWEWHPDQGWQRVLRCLEAPEASGG